MKKYFLIWLIGGLISELSIYCTTLAEHEIPRNFFGDMAFLFNPYALIYMGSDLYSEGYWAAFGVMHTARFIWLMSAMGLEYWSRKYKPLKYVAWGMLVIYFAANLFVLPGY